MGLSISVPGYPGSHLQQPSTERLCQNQITFLCGSMPIHCMCKYDLGNYDTPFNVPNPLSQL